MRATVVAVSLLLASLSSLHQVDGCVTWYDDCIGRYNCLPGFTPTPGCTVTIPQSVAPPPPGACNDSLDGCYFVNPCKAWNKGCYGVDYQCTLESEFIEYNETHPVCHPYHPLPPPKEQCMYINDTCQWYDGGCGLWSNECDGVYQCGTAIDAYLHTHQGVEPICPSPAPPTSILPPGECLYQSGDCTWSQCHSWLDWCMYDWYCGAMYDYQAYLTTPPHPCPAPPQNYTPPAQPGICQYNFTSGRCQFDQPTELYCSQTYNNCSGHYSCTPGLPPTPSCSTPIVPKDVAPPPPGLCTAGPFDCIFYNPCKAWFKGCYGGSYQCTLTSEYLQYNATHPSCSFDRPLPPPMEQCLYIDTQCQWYSEGCGLWSNECDQVYQCGTVIEQYKHTHQGVEPVCPYPTPPTAILPPGQCIYKSGNCTWSTCRMWLDWCETYWLCGDEYDYQMYWITTPPPPCPHPPPGYKPPNPSGVCQYNTSTSLCQFSEPTEPSCSLSYDNCTGSYYCSHDTVTINDSSCTVVIPQDIAPPPSGICTDVSGFCFFYNPCMSWNKGCYGVDYQCTLISEYLYYNATNPSFPSCPKIPPPKQECLYINNTCQWYNGCGRWFDECANTYECGTVVEKYINEQSPICPTPPRNETLPPGDCIYQSGNCTWSNCKGWLDWCRFNWLCGDEYDYEAYFTTPPPPCPPPPQNYTPPKEPGVCKYNLTLQRCSYDRKEVNPCAMMTCPAGSVCKVYQPNGRAYCDPSCDIVNGGCNSTQTCSLVPVQCITAPCPPMVKCTDDPCATVRCSNKCVSNNTQALCLPSCYANNGGCSSQICTVSLHTPCPQGGSLCSYTTCSSSEDYLSGACPTGQILRSCGSACQKTCYNYNQLIVCPAVCVVDQCECPTGLVMYRDRCVDPLECPSLLQSPPPLDPLPIPSDTVLVQFTAVNISLDGFDRKSYLFRNSVRSVLVANGLTTPTITIYDIIANTSDLLYIILNIKSDSIAADSSLSEVVSILLSNMDRLTINITSITPVTSQYNHTPSNKHSTANIIGIIIGGVVIVLAVVLVVIATVGVFVKYGVRYRRSYSSKNVTTTKEVYSVLSSDDSNPHYTVSYY